MTRLARALRRRARVLRRGRVEAAGSGDPPDGARYDALLTHLYGDRLDRIETACREPGAWPFALFADLDVDLWALLLTQQYEVFPRIRALLPDVPDAALQETWNGASGARLAAQSAAFYTKLVDGYARHGARSLREARVLDFGCGWGRLTRFLARDVSHGRLYGCDPAESILDVCRDNGVPAILARTDFAPERLPFEERFDLAFAFSVFTHLSEETHRACLRALHRALHPGGILVVTIRPPEYLRHSSLMRPLLESGAGQDLEGERYLFVPHAADPTHPQYAGGEMTYGETVVTLQYVRRRWASLFELLDVELIVGDLYQVMLTLRRT